MNCYTKSRKARISWIQ